MTSEKSFRLSRLGNENLFKGLLSDSVPKAGGVLKFACPQDAFEKRVSLSLEEGSIVFSFEEPILKIFKTALQKSWGRAISDLVGLHPGPAPERPRAVPSGKWPARPGCGRRCRKEERSTALQLRMLPSAQCNKRPTNQCNQRGPSAWAKGQNQCGPRAP